jgi:hypothetical protein
MAGPNPRARQRGGNQNTFAYPLTIRGQLGSTPSDHAQRSVGGLWYNDNAVDISVSENTGVKAVADGTIGSVSIRGRTPDSTTNSGSTVFLTTEGDEWAYMHLNDVSVSQGDQVTKGQLIGESGIANNSAHLHLGRKNGNPMDVLDGDDSGTTGSSSNPTQGNNSPVDEATAKAAAFATYFNIEGLFDTTNSILLKGDKSLMNDKPLFPFIEQLVSASMRRFQSMPNGNFYAFYPDYFGGSKHRRPYWEIRDIEIVDGQIELSDDSLSTHVFVIGDTQDSFGITTSDMDQSAGIINIFNAFQADFISGHGEQQRPGPINKDAETGEGPKASRVIDHDEAVAFLKKYGARPYMEEAPMVRSAFYEAFLAYQKFCLLWAQQFSSQFQLTFMPELFPGGLVAFPDHGIQMFVEEVTHAFDYSTGFRTDVTFSSPASLDGKGKEHEGMIRAGSLDTSREN